MAARCWASAFKTLHPRRAQSTLAPGSTLRIIGKGHRHPSPPDRPTIALSEGKTAFSPLPHPPPSPPIPQVPQPQGKITDPASFLSSLRRPALAESASKFSSWEDLFRRDAKGLEAAGLQARDRRYLLRCMQNYRKGQQPHTFAAPQRKKPKVRAWGPRVQNGIRKKVRRP